MDLSAAQAALEPWLPACEARLHLAVPGYEQKPTAERLQLVLQQCLLSDFNLGGGRCLPPGVQVRRQGCGCLLSAARPCPLYRQLTAMGPFPTCPLAAEPARHHAQRQLPAAAG